MRATVHDRLNAIPRAVNPPSVAVSCALRERSPDPTASTCPNVGSRRLAPSGAAPVAGTIAAAGTYTGRLPSSGSVKPYVACVFRLMSVIPYCASPHAYIASSPAVHRSQKRRVTPSDARTERGEAKSGAIAVSVGTEVGSANVDVPTRCSHVVGIAATPCARIVA